MAGDGRGGERLKVIVVGAGIGGSSTAILLSKLPGVSVSVYDRDEGSSVRRYQGYSLGIQPNGISVFKKLGVLEQIKSERAYSSNIHLCHKSGRFDVQLPDKTLQVERGRIMDVLHQEMHSKNINIHFGMKCIGFEEGDEGVTVKFERGEEVKCDILIAADGSRSAVRQQMNFPDDKQQYSVYAISFQLPMDHPAAKGLTKTQSIMGQGIRFISKLNDPKVTISLDIAIPYGEVEKRWPNKSDMLRDVKQSFVHQNFYVADSIKLIDVEPDGCRYIMDRTPLKAWKAGRVMLMGDACHPMTPFMGQGANVALEDSVGIYEAVERIVNNNTPIEEALNKFERDMLARSTPMVRKARLMAWMYSIKHPIPCFIRDIFIYIMVSIIVWRTASAHKKID